MKTIELNAEVHSKLQDIFYLVLLAQREELQRSGGRNGLQLQQVTSLELQCHDNLRYVRTEDLTVAQLQITATIVAELGVKDFRVEDLFRCLGESGKSGRFILEAH